MLVAVVFALAAANANANFRLPPDVVPLDVQMTLTLDPKAAFFEGEETIRVRLPRATKRIALHGRKLEVNSASVAGHDAAWVVVDDDGRADLVVKDAVGPGDVDVHVVWRAAFDSGLQGAYVVNAAGDAYVFTQFQAIGARRAFPCFDEPGFKAPLSLTIVTTTGNTAVANGRTVSASDNRFVFEKTAPLPTYLYAFATGPFDVVDAAPVPPSATRATPLPLRGIAPRGQGARMKLSLSVATDAVLALERYFDAGFPFAKLDLVAVPDFPLGGMENAGMITFRDNFVLVDERAPVGQIKAHAGIVAHEVSHQWFGDLVTPAWWDDIWLNEAFATWITSNHIVDEIRPQFHSVTDARASLAAVTAKDSLISARQIRQPVLSTDDITNVFDDITYEKGAAVIAMFEHDVGKDVFRAGVRAHIKAHAGGTATAQDLLAAVSLAAKRDIAPAFRSFLEQPGVPLIAQQLECKDGKAQVALSQKRYLPLGSKGKTSTTWKVPVCVRYEVGAAWQTACTTMITAQATLPLPQAACTTRLHGNADGLGYYRWSTSAASLSSLAGATSSLSPGERISFGDAVRAAYGQGTLLFADALAAALPLAVDEEPTVAGVPRSLLYEAQHNLVPEARTKVQQKTATTFLPVVARLQLLPGKDDDARTRELRSLAIRTLVYDAEEPLTTMALAKLGRLYLGVDGDHRIHDEQCPRDLQDVAVFAAVRSGGVAVFDEVVGHLADEQDGRVRQLLLRAAGGVVDEGLAARARDLAVDARLRNNEVFVTLFPQARDPRTRDATWAWFQPHVDVLAGKLPPEWGGDALYRVFDTDCTAAQAKEIGAFFATKKLPGGPRPVEQLLEQIRLCDARRAAHVESARRVFAP